MSDEAAQSLFGNCQEALINAVRHGGSTELSVTVHQLDTLFELTIADNGWRNAGAAAARYRDRFEDHGVPRADDTFVFRYCRSKQRRDTLRMLPSEC